jgi:cell division protein FtsA
MKEEKVFVLDIGTCSVVGLLAEKTGSSIRVCACEIEEHSKRAMLDGQIHDIPEVALVVRRIKEKLEKIAGESLQKVSVAAAGRILKTARGRETRDISLLKEISQEEVVLLQYEAVQNAYKNLQTRTGEYHCVGFALVSSYLDGTETYNLIGQRGNKMEVEVIATFLPRVVVDSLQTVLETANLEILTLTLEPIAAFEVAIPSSMRKLNLVLVDIGAGTSDIAVASDGKVIGFDMVPAAGDEITEEICSKYLLDFPVGERVKRQLGAKKEVQFTDILGFKHKLSSSQIVASITVTNVIAKQVAEKILSINGKTPQAVLCVGGGSLMPGLTEKIALHLGLPSNRVSIRGKESIQGFTDIPKILDGPHCITPLGIVMTTFSRQAMTFVQVTVNSRTIRLLKAGNLTVAEALLTAGVQMRHLYGKPGPGLTVRVNNQVYTIKGGIPQAALVTKNGQKAGFDDKIIEGDSVEFIPAKDGEPAKGFIRDVIPKLLSKTIVVNGNKIVLKPVLLMNGIEVDEKTPLIDNANIYYQKYDTVAEVASFLGKKKVRAMLNGKEAVEDTIINDGDSVNFIDELDEKITVVINDKEYYVPFAGSEMILLDVFSHIDIDASNLSRQRYMIEINGIEAAFTTPIHKDDKIGIKWH